MSRDDLRCSNHDTGYNGKKYSSIQPRSCSASLGRTLDPRVLASGHWVGTMFFVPVLEARALASARPNPCTSVSGVVTSPEMRNKIAKSSSKTHRSRSSCIFVLEEGVFFDQKPSSLKLAIHPASCPGGKLATCQGHALSESSDE